MEKEIKLPSISEGQEKGKILEIYVKEGDTVEEEQALVSVESDKANVDVPAEYSGTISSIKVSEDDEVAVGDILLVIETSEDQEKEQEDEPSDEKEEEEKKETEEKKGKEADREKKKPTREVSEDKGSDASNGPSEDETSESADAPAAPLAKKFARELGLDISDLTGEDPEERVTREDVFEYAKKLIKKARSRKTSSGENTTEPDELPDFSKWGKTERQPMDGVRRTIADNTHKSWRTIPHVTQFDEADITDVEAYRKEQKEQKEVNLTITAILLKILSHAMEHFPKFNASLDMKEKDIIFKQYFNIGVAADTDRGLLIPVVKNVDQKSVLDLAKEIVELGQKARDGSLKKEEMQGGNIVISNLGGIGGTQFTPVIFPPQSAIIGVSRASTRPIYDAAEDTFRPRLILPLSVSYDHRLIDGADAARFLRWICTSLENPLGALLE